MNYYNEHDRKAAAWLRELIKEGHIAEGEVDERSIADVQPTDLLGFIQCHFFAGIGGWSYALRLAGWPDDRPVWTGSCPCQPFSAAGKGLADKDPRHLWPEFFRLIAACGPAAVFGEQVASKAGRLWLGGVRADLETLAYRVGAADLCAAGVGAPHIRQRLFWMAHSKHSHRRSEFEQGEQGEHGRSGSPGSSANGRLADSDGSEQGRGQFGLHAQNGDDHGPARDGERSEESGGLADMQQPGLERHAGHGHNGHEPGRLGANAVGSTAEGGVVSRLGNAGSTGSGRNPRAISGAEGKGEGERIESGSLANEPVIAGPRSGATERLGDTSSRGCGERRDASLAGSGGHVERADWSRFDLIPCRDGKARRIESGTFPLAHGVSGRVGLLRGYGNAIVPRLAAEFILASEEAIRQKARSRPSESY